MGDTSTSTPTCGDDMLIITTSAYELQVLLYIITNYANAEHYIIHPAKSMIILFNTSSTHQQDWFIECKPWSINGKPLPVNLELVHVGIQRDILKRHTPYY